MFGYHAAVNALSCFPQHIRARDTLVIGKKGLAAEANHTAVI
jgi:hypothetical protein